MTQGPDNIDRTAERLIADQDAIQMLTERRLMPPVPFIANPVGMAYFYLNWRDKKNKANLAEAIKNSPGLQEPGNRLDDLEPAAQAREIIHLFYVPPDPSEL